MIKLDNITAGYNGIPVISNLDLTIPYGSFFGIVGPSGIGKSTVLRLIAGLLEPLSGTIKLDNDILYQDNQKISRAEKTRITQKVGYIFQDFCLFPNLTVRQNLAIVQKKKDEQQLNSLLDQFGLTERMNAYPDELSGGQKQRVAIARSLVLEPEILLIDEATSSLDEELALEFMDYMASLNQKGLTIVLITHDKKLVQTYCNQSYNMNEKTI